MRKIENWSVDRNRPNAQSHVANPATNRVRELELSTRARRKTAARSEDSLVEAPDIHADRDGLSLNQSDIVDYSFLRAAVKTK